MHKVLVILRYVVLSILLLIFAGMIILQSPKVQTWAAGKAVDVLQEYFDAKVSLGGLHFKPINTVVISSLTIIDKNPYCPEAHDTLAYIGSLSARFSLRSLSGLGGGGITLNEAKMRDSRFNLVIEPDDLYSCNLVRIFKLLPKDDQPPMPEDVLSIRNVIVENLRFTMQNFATEPIEGLPETAIDWNDLKVDDINMRARNFHIGDGLFSGKVRTMSFRESSGWCVEELSGDAVAGKGRVIVDNIHLFDGQSEAWLDYKMLGTSEQYRNYVNEVVMITDIKESRWSMQTLSHFIPPLNPDPDCYAIIKGHQKGPVSCMEARDISIKFENTGFSTLLNGTVKNLPDVKNMYFNATMSGTRFTTREVTDIVGHIAPRAGLDVSSLGKGDVYCADIRAKGFINKLAAEIKLHKVKDQGKFNLSATIRNTLKEGNPPVTVNGRASSDAFDFGSLLGIEDLGRLTADVQLSATAPARSQQLQVSADSLKIAGLEWKGYNYSGILANASLSGKDLTADIVARDPSLDADITVWSDKDFYNASAIVRKADLSAMNIDSRQTGEATLNLYARMDKDLSNIAGSAGLSEIYLTNADGTHHVDDINVTATFDGEEHNIVLDSQFASANIVSKGGNVSASVGTIDTSALLAYVLPGMYLEKGSVVEMSMDSTGFVRGSLSSGRVAIGPNFIKDIEAYVSGPRDSLTARIKARGIEAVGYKMHNNTLDAVLKDGKKLSIDYKFDNRECADGSLFLEDQFSDGSLKADIQFTDGGVDIDILPSHLGNWDSVWDIARSKASIHGREIVVDSLALKNGIQSIELHGKTSEEDEEQLQAIIKDFDLAICNKVIRNYEMGISGTLNAQAKLLSPLGTGIPGLELQLQGDSLQVDGVRLGTLSAHSSYDIQEGNFKLIAVERIENLDAMKALVRFSPEKKDIRAMASFNAFPFGWAHAFIPSVFSRMEGTVSGNLDVKGPLGDMNISSKNARIDNALLEVGFTRVPYTLGGTFHVDNNGIHLDDVKARDRFNGTATAGGALRWNRLRNLNMDIKMKIKNMEAIDIPLSDPGLIKGHIFGTGTVGFTGPFSRLLLGADVVTTGDSNMHISLSGTVDAAKGDLLTFVDPRIKEVDPYETMLAKYRQKEIEQSNFFIAMRALANPSLSVSLDLGSNQFSSGLEGRGNGEITMNLNTNTSDFSILGDYTLTEGTFNVNASNLVKRNFSIKEGSSIKFAGDIMESTVNIDASYSAKASIGTLIADTTSVTNRRVVNCGIKVQDKLTNPQVKFSIDIPDLDPSVKSSVESALSTEDKVQKQFLSLLLSNSFLPDEQGGIVNNTSLLYSNVSEMMANQINNIFSRLDIPLDLGLNYQPTERGTNVFDVAISTQLFNNRVIVGGSFGNRQSASSGNSSVVGDLDIQVKLNRPGSLRLNMFSHSADQYSNFLDNSQRNGAGITWQQEFDTFKGLIQRLFTPKSKRTSKEAEEKKKITLILDE